MKSADDSGDKMNHLLPLIDGGCLPGQSNNASTQSLVSSGEHMKQKGSQTESHGRVIMDWMHRMDRQQTTLGDSEAVLQSFENSLPTVAVRKEKTHAADEKIQAKKIISKAAVAVVKQACGGSRKRLMHTASPRNADISCATTVCSSTNTSGHYSPPPTSQATMRHPGETQKQPRTVTPASIDKRKHNASSMMTTFSARNEMPPPHPNMGGGPPVQYYSMPVLNGGPMYPGLPYPPQPGFVGYPPPLVMVQRGVPPPLGYYPPPSPPIMQSYAYHQYPLETGAIYLRKQKPVGSKRPSSTCLRKKTVKKAKKSKATKPSTPPKSTAVTKAAHGKMTDKEHSLATGILRGVTMRPSGKWQAQLYWGGKSQYIGVFDTREKANLAYEIVRGKLKSAATPSTSTPVDKASAMAAVSEARKAAFEGAMEDYPPKPHKRNPTNTSKPNVI